MSPSSLNPATAAQLRSAPLTYTPGTSATEGCRRFERSRTIQGREFDALSADLLRWVAHEGAGLRVEASDIPLRRGTVVQLRLPGVPGAVAVSRVVEVIDEPLRRGFAYATLPGHAEAGEEAFVLEQLPDGGVRFTGSALSRPASLLARLGGPVTRLVQDAVTHRYLRALGRDERAPRRALAP